MARNRGLVATADAQVVPVGQNAELSAFNFTGFTNVKLYNGNGSGTLLIEVATAGFYSLGGNTAWFPNGIFADVTGSGSLTLWVE